MPVPEGQLDIERTLVVSAIVDRAVLGYLAGRIRAEDFEDPTCRNAWAMLAAGKKPSGKIVEQLGEASQVTVQEAPEAVRKLKAAAALRAVRQICARAMKGLQNGAAKDPEKFVLEFSKAAARVSLPTAADDLVKSPGEWLEGGFKEIESRRQGGKPRWFDLGLSDLSRALALEPGHLAILAAETGKGKTALALNIAARLGVDQGIPVLYVNTEMSWEELAFRLYAIMAGVNLFNLRAGQSSDLEMRRIERARRSKQAGNALYITDALPWASAGDVSSLAREYAVTVGLKVLVVDYVQRLETTGEDEQWLALLTAAKEFKSLAQELGILVILVAQLNDRQQLAGSKGMLREADAAVLLEELEPQERVGKNITHRLRVIKSRHTAGGVTIDVVLHPETLKVFGIDRSADEFGAQGGGAGNAGDGNGSGPEELAGDEWPLDFVPEEWLEEFVGANDGDGNDTDPG